MFEGNAEQTGQSARSAAAIRRGLLQGNRYQKRAMQSLPLSHRDLRGCKLLLFNYLFLYKLIIVFFEKRRY